MVAATATDASASANRATTRPRSYSDSRPKPPSATGAQAARTPVCRSRSTLARANCPARSLGLACRVRNSLSSSTTAHTARPGSVSGTRPAIMLLAVCPNCATPPDCAVFAAFATSAGDIVRTSVSVLRASLPGEDADLVVAEAGQPGGTQLARQRRGGRSNGAVG